ncbi:hypothetical protein C1646_616990, partial [Rhizophagus diaphanus]
FSGKLKLDYVKLEQLDVSFLGECTASVFCAIASHPADTFVSKVILAVFNHSICTRVILIGTLIALQWLTYNYPKVSTRLPTTDPSGSLRVMLIRLV